MEHQARSGHVVLMVAQPAFAHSIWLPLTTSLPAPNHTYNCNCV